MLYAESDGRHIAALDSIGKLLWVRDPYSDGRLRPYRTARPVLWRISPLPEGYANLMRKAWAAGPFVMIEFDSSQFGAIDLRNGNYFDLGQN